MRIFYIFSLVSIFIFLLQFLHKKIHNNKILSVIIISSLWIYCSILPTIIIILIRFGNIENIIKQNFFLYICLLIIILPVIIQIMFLKKYTGNKNGIFNSGRKEKITSIKNFNSTKTMEYFVTMILPFITISNKLEDKITIFFIFIILIFLIIKLQLYYFNLPILLFFYVYEVTLNDEEEYYIISKSKINEIGTYRMIKYSNYLKIGILIETK